MSEVIEIEVLDPGKPIAAYNPIKAGIAALAEKYGKTVFSIATTKDMDATKAARAEVRDVRYNVEAVRKELKAPALAYSRRIDAEAAEYTAALLAIEAPIDEVIKVEELRKAEEKAERDRVEAEKRQEAQAAIDAIKSTAVNAVGKTAEQIHALIGIASAHPVTLDDYGDRTGEAEIAKQQTLSRLQEMHAAAVRHETEQAQLAADRAKLARQQAEQTKAAAEARRIEDQRLAGERAKLAAEQAEAKRTQDAAAEEMRLAREAIADEAAAAAKHRADVQADFERQRDEFEAKKAAAEKVERDRLSKIAFDEQVKKDAETKAAQDKADDIALAAKAKADAAVAETARRERIQFEENGPGQEEIVTVLAAHYDVEISTVIHWLSALTVTESA